MSTHDIVENWRQEAIQEGVKQGRELGVELGRELGVELGRELGVKLGLEQSLERERQLMLRLLRRRFGASVDGEVERRVAAASAEQIEVWIERVLSAGSIAELLAD